MQVQHPKHFLSIDLQLQTDNPIIHQQLIGKKHHRLTILVGCTHRSSSQVSILGNNQQQDHITKKSASTIDGVRYRHYFNKKQPGFKKKYFYLRDFTQRRIHHDGGTLSLCKDICQDKYKVNKTQQIDYTTQKSTITPIASTNKNILSDVTNNIKKNLIQIFKSNIKKKVHINQGQLNQINGGNKKNQYQKQNQYYIGNLHKLRKLNKIRKQWDSIAADDQKQKLRNNKYLFTERSNTIDMIQQPRKINKQKNIKQTKQLQQCQVKHHKVSSTYELKSINKKNNKEIMKNQCNQSNNKSYNFNKYLKYINLKKKQIISNKKFDKNIQLNQSIPFKNMINKQTIDQIPKKQQSINHQHQKFPYKQKYNQTKQSNFKTDQKRVSSLMTQQIINQSKNDFNHDFDCSSIPQISQSQFMSQSLKNQIIKTNIYCQEQKINRNYFYNNRYHNFGENINEIKKKKKKKNSKMNILCRSQIKQVFPQRFFY